MYKVIAGMVLVAVFSFCASSATAEPQQRLTCENSEDLKQALNEEEVALNKAIKESGDLEYGIVYTFELQTVKMVQVYLEQWVLEHCRKI